MGKIEELLVSQKWVERYNEKFRADLEAPTRSQQDPPDYKTRSKNNKKATFGLEVTAAWPEEAEELGKYKESEAIYDDTNVELLLTNIYENLEKGKACHYSADTKASLTILLYGEGIKCDDEDLEKVLRISTTSKWQIKFKELGFKQVWYVSHKDIYQLF